MPEWPAGASDMAARMRAYDWADTPLGPIGLWPQSLKTVVDMMLASPSMMSLVWGADAIHLYNDHFAELLREHQTQTLGKSAYRTFARSGDVFAADMAAGLSGKSARLVAQRYPVLRNGQLEDAWFDVDYAPLRDEAGQVAGVLWTLNETTAQVLAERALRKSDARHRLLIGTWTQAVWETDADGGVVVDSPSWRAYTGQTLEEWLGYGWLNAIHRDDRSYAERQWQEAIACRGLLNAEFRLRAPDGGWRWTNVRAAPFLDQAGEIEGWAGINIDIDARKRAEDALRAREADLARVQRIGQVGGLDIDVGNGLTSYRSPEYLRLHGLTQDAAAENHVDWLARVHPNDREAAERALFDALGGTDMTYESEYRIIRPNDGAVRWIAVRADIERDADGKAVRLIGAHVDITEQKGAHRALAESEERLRGVLNAMAEGFASFDANFTIQDVNAETLRLDGRAREELVGRSHWEAFPGTEHSALGTLYRQVARDRIPGAVEYAYAWPDGRTMWVDVRAYPTPDGGMAVFWRDISDRKAAAEALRDSEERYRSLFESMDEAYAVIDVLKGENGAWTDFRFVEVNPAFITHTGIPWPVGRTATELLGSPNPRWIQLYGQALDTGRPIRVEESEPTLDLVFDLNIFALDRERNRVAVLFTNITERKRAEAELRASEERLASAVEVGRIGLWDWNVRTGHVHWSDEHFRMHGYAVGEVAPSYDAWLARLHPDDRDAAQAALRHAMEAHEDYAHEFRTVRPDGSVRWLSGLGRFFYEADQPVRMIGAMVDVTDRRDWSERQKTLLAELQHRVRNILAVIRSLVRRTHEEGQTAEEFIQHLEGRLEALARTQVLLTRSVNNGINLELLIRDELTAQATRSDSLSLRGDTVLLSPKMAEVLTLAVHELTTNAVKYGALSSRGGRIDVEWRVEDRGDRHWLVLRWSEDGVRVVQSAPRRQGFGTELITRRVPYELRGSGSLKLRPGGILCELEVPLIERPSILQTDAGLRPSFGS